MTADTETAYSKLERFRRRQRSVTRKTNTTRNYLNGSESRYLLIESSSTAPQLNHVSKKNPPELQAIISASDNGMHATTIALAKKWLIGDPDNVRVLIYLGHANWQIACYDNAESAFHQAAERCDPAKRDVIFGELGNLHRAKGDFSTATHWFEKQIETDPRDATGYFFLGTMQMKLGQLDAAAATLHRAESCEYGDIPGIHLTLGMILTAQGNLMGAADEFTAALKLDPDFAAAKIASKDNRLARAAKKQLPR
jgi:tetratricopeptide (TPR) repeat protein